MTFDLHQLHAFTTIVATGSLGRAAVALNVTQPALSRTIRRLEEKIGAAVFERHTKGMQLTPIGVALLPHAQLLRREAELAREEIDAMRGLAKGTIRVGAVGSIASHVLPQAIDGVLRKWPGLQVHVVEGVWDRLAEALVKREIDLALGAWVPDSGDLFAIADCQWRDTSHVVASMHHPLHSRRRLRLADTLGQKWVLFPKDTEPHVHMEKVFAAHGLGMPQSMVETRSVTVLKSLVARSDFLGWMPEPMYDAERQAGLIGALPIAGVAEPRTLTAFRRRNGILSGPAVKLLDELRLLAASGDHPKPATAL